jgi:hypothetical protein
MLYSQRFISNDLIYGKILIILLNTSIIEGLDMRRKYRDNWFERTFDTPEKKAKFYLYATVAQLISWIMIVLGIILFILIVSGILKV